MNFPARGSARILSTGFLWTGLLAFPCLAQDVTPAPDYLNPNFARAAACTDLSQSGAPQNSPATGAAPDAAAIPAATHQEEPPGGKRVFGVLPNYRTASSCDEGNTINTRRKLQIALKDSFDYPLILLSAAYAGLDQLSNDEPSFGQGVKGYAHRLATNYADQAVGNMMTEGFLPALFHQDPRYFQRGNGHSKRYRAGYALTRVIFTDSDSGKREFNYSEWVGNATAAAVSNLYEPDDRTASANVYKLLEYVGTDAVSQVLKEFWPDIKHKLFHRGNPEEPCAH